MTSPPNSATQPEEPLKNLPGTWRSCGRGWNMIALPFADGDKKGQLKYRLLLNRYNEILKFSKVGDLIPNRGVVVAGAPDKVVVADDPRQVVKTADQFVTALDYEQTIEQSAATDFPKSGEAGSIELPIHHEPGLWLHMHDDQRTGRLDIARLATIPHGNSVLALGESSEFTPGESFQIPEISGLPIWKRTEQSPSDTEQPPVVSNRIKSLLVRDDELPLPEQFSKLNDRLTLRDLTLGDLLGETYLKPYKKFHKNKFEKEFTPVNPNQLLNVANEKVTFKSITMLHVDTAVKLIDKKTVVGGIIDIPFITKRADATRMTSTFWIQEIEGLNGSELRLQYTQTVLLDFAGFFWPHVSINTLKKDKKDDM